MIHVANETMVLVVGQGGFVNILFHLEFERKDWFVWAGKCLRLFFCLFVFLTMCNYLLTEARENLNN